VCHSERSEESLDGQESPSLALYLEWSMCPYVLNVAANPDSSDPEVILRLAQNDTP
jgi:hypothetical protein